MSLDSGGIARAIQLSAALDVMRHPRNSAQRRIEHVEAPPDMGVGRRARTPDSRSLRRGCVPGAEDAGTVRLCRYWLMGAQNSRAEVPSAKR